MLAVVKMPHTDLEIRGEIPAAVLKVLRREFGSKLTIMPDSTDEKLESVFESAEYEEFKDRITSGDYIRTYRQNLGFTQASLGEKLGVSRAFICDIEHNRRLISKQIAKKLSRLFDVSISRFI